MKFYLKPILSVFALAILLGYAGCGPDGGDETSEEEVQLGKLSGTWKVGANGDVKLGAVSKKGEYSDFTLILTGTPGATSYGYTTSGRPPLSPWPAAGTWNFGTDVTKDAVRDKGTNGQLEMNYIVNGDNLEISFNYQGGGEPARTSEVKGSWVFNLTKQQ